MDDKQIDAVWGVVANVVDERLHGESGEIRSGTKHFVPGAKVYYHSAYWGDAAEKVTVTGRHRGSSKLVTVDMARHHLYKWRAKLIYKPAVLKRLRKNFCELLDGRRVDDPETAARELAEYFNNHPSLNVRAIDRPLDLADDLVNSWKADGMPGLEVFDQFVADRAIVLYQNVTPIGVGKSTSSGELVCWVQPAYESQLRFLEKRLSPTPINHQTSSQ